MPRGGVRIFPWGHHIFYECHQCFYASAVELFTDASGDRRFEALRFRALNFIFGDNRWRLPLDEIGLQGLPVRCVSKGGSVTLWRNQFKGCYEVGAYLWALSSAVRDETSS
jgi:hypothetical protein